MRRQGRSYKLLFAVCLVVGLVAISLTSGSSAPKTGGKIRMSLADSDVTSFDPIVPFDNMSIWTMLHMYDQLVRVGKDGRSVEPDAADSWKVTPDGKTWTFHIRRPTPPSR